MQSTVFWSLSNFLYPNHVRATEIAPLRYELLVLTRPVGWSPPPVRNYPSSLSRSPSSSVFVCVTFVSCRRMHGVVQMSDSAVKKYMSSCRTALLHQQMDFAQLSWRCPSCYDLPKVWNFGHMVKMGPSLVSGHVSALNIHDKPLPLKYNTDSLSDVILLRLTASSRSTQLRHT